MSENIKVSTGTCPKCGRETLERRTAPDKWFVERCTYSVTKRIRGQIEVTEQCTYWGCGREVS